MKVHGHPEVFERSLREKLLHLHLAFGEQFPTFRIDLLSDPLDHLCGKDVNKFTGGSGAGGGG